MSGKCVSKLMLQLQILMIQCQLDSNTLTLSNNIMNLKRISSHTSEDKIHKVEISLFNLPVSQNCNTSCPTIKSQIKMELL